MEVLVCTVEEATVDILEGVVLDGCDGGEADNCSKIEEQEDELGDEALVEEG